ncbi:unnamed protein product [Medioppia subpectinata]|uniref:Uncharacterized protein n=1 Tax=Medioppia subpectinata TaxID=1979941 RepID=A0A7R9PU71_9ACAR|nr:unnamed protein product [Medioppia subpectinata]CAG2100887.1 unnamed protein product [Medioppia subpectinata]
MSGCAALSAVAQVIDQLDETTIRKMVLPKTKQIFENNCGVKTISNTITKTALREGRVEIL